MLARMAELADALDSKSSSRKGVRVRPPLRAPFATVTVTQHRALFVLWFLLNNPQETIRSWPKSVINSHSIDYIRSAETSEICGLNGLASVHCRIAGRLLAAGESNLSVYPPIIVFMRQASYGG